MPSHQPTPDFSAALPRRPITVRPPQTVGPQSAIGVFVLLFGLLGGVLWWLGPDLARDWRLRGDLVAASGIHLDEARCATRIFIVKVCEIRFTRSDSANGGQGTFWYLYVATAGDERVALLRARSDPTQATSDLGQEKLFGRTLTLLVAVAFLVFCIGLLVQLLRQGMVARRAFAELSGQRLQLVVVAVDGSLPIAHKRKRWTYVHDAGGTEARGVIELASSINPLFVTPDGKRALALIGPAGGIPLLLDAQLHSLDLSEAEKEAFFAACRKALGGPEAA